jgi:hypothetical protein
MNHVLYFHFLQPNQYVPRSKPMGKEEKSTAFAPKGGYRACVMLGYPVLRREGQHLIDAGVVFTDLTMAFKDIEQPVYVDTCCHVGELGSRIIADAIANVIQQRLQ